VSETYGASPSADCPLCPRLAEYRQANRAAHADWFNAPVPSFGRLDAPLLIVGLAPGVRGANRTGRPFTGDFAGDLLYRTLLYFDLAEGDYRADPSDSLRLIGCRVTNAVRCVPPANLPTPSEVGACNGFLAAEIAALPSVRVVVCLGKIAWDGYLAHLLAAGVIARRSDYTFGHAVEYRLPNGIHLLGSYHPSLRNTNTGKLNRAMFARVFVRARELAGLK